MIEFNVNIVKWIILYDHIKNYHDVTVIPQASIHTLFLLKENQENINAKEEGVVVAPK